MENGGKIVGKWNLLGHHTDFVGRILGSRQNPNKIHMEYIRILSGMGNWSESAQASNGITAWEMSWKITGRN